MKWITMRLFDVGLMFFSLTGCSGLGVSGSSSSAGSFPAETGQAQTKPGAAPIVEFEHPQAPIQGLAASMSTKQPIYQGNERVILIVENKAPTAIIFGTRYWLEASHEGEWTKVQKKGILVFNDLGIVLGSGVWEQEIQWDELPSGHYRFGKEIRGEGTDMKQQLYAEFDVKN
jgi:hypothetical protein